jgi:hypothetical protein
MFQGCLDDNALYFIDVALPRMAAYAMRFSPGDSAAVANTTRTIGGLPG